MLALGCIQALRCNANICPTGVAAQNAALYKGLDISLKTERVYRYHHATIRSLFELLGAMGMNGPHEIMPGLVFRSVDDLKVKTLEEIYDFLLPGQILDGGDLPDGWRREWNAA